MDKDKKLLERYYELEKLIKGINIVNFPGKDDSLEEMNKWISKIIEFYKRCGINLSYNDFKDPFDKRTSNYMKINDVINKYMEIYFKNRNNLDSYEFTRVLFSFGDIDITEGKNPIKDEIQLMMSNFNNKHKDIFDKVLGSVRENYLDLDIDERLFKYDKMDNLLNSIKIKTLELEKKIEIYESEKLKEDKKKEEEKKHIDKIDEVCNLITYGKYMGMNSEERKNVVVKLPHIMDTIIRLRIFNLLLGEYNTYSKNNNYSEVLREVKFGYEDIITKSQEIEELKIERGIVLGKKRLFVNSAKEASKIDDKIRAKEMEIQKIRQDIHEKIKNYFKGFYDKYNITELENKFNMDLMSQDKLLGLFDFDKIPRDMDNIKEIDLFGSSNIKLPKVGSPEFNNISKLCLEVKNEEQDKGTIHKKR